MQITYNRLHIPTNQQDIVTISTERLTYNLSEYCVNNIYELLNKWNSMFSGTWQYWL